MQQHNPKELREKIVKRMRERKDRPLLGVWTYMSRRKFCALGLVADTLDKNDPGCIEWREYKPRSKEISELVPEVGSLIKSEYEDPHELDRFFAKQLGMLQRDVRELMAYNDSDYAPSWDAIAERILSIPYTNTKENTDDRPNE